MLSKLLICDGLSNRTLKMLHTQTNDPAVNNICVRSLSICSIVYAVYRLDGRYSHEIATKHGFAQYHYTFEDIFTFLQQSLLSWCVN